MKMHMLACLSAALLVGCSVTSTKDPADVLTYRSAADPAQGIRPQHPGNVIDGYTHRNVTTPEEWRRLNQEQTSTLGVGS